MVGFTRCSMARAPSPPAADPTAAPTTPPTGPAIAVPIAAPAMPAAAAPMAVAPAISGCPCSSSEDLGEDLGGSVGGTFFTSSLMAMRTRLAASPCRANRRSWGGRSNEHLVDARPRAGPRSLVQRPVDEKRLFTRGGRFQMSCALRLLACLLVAAIGCRGGAAGSGAVGAPDASVPDA